MAQTPSFDQRVDEPIGDYVVGSEAERIGDPLGTKLLRAFHWLLLLILAVISFALFWLVGVMLGIL